MNKFDFWMQHIWSSSVLFDAHHRPIRSLLFSDVCMSATAQVLLLKGKTTEIVDDKLINYLFFYFVFWTVAK